MKNIKRKHLLFALSALLSICFYACYDGEEWDAQQGVHRVSPTKRNKQLTTSVARQWYESNYDPVVSVSTRSGDEMPALIKPKWANATERNRGRYEVVQMPILTRTSRIIVDEDTRLHFDELRMQKKLRNSTHLVILKDLKTGNIRSFISVFVGSYDYLKKTTRMSRNTYLYREKDFDGKVLFFKLNGSMINGWKYRDGKIVGKITPIDEDTKILMTRSGYWEEECRIETNYEYVEECEDAPEETDWDEEYGIGPVIRPPICENVLVPIDTRVCEYVWVEEDDDDIEGGVDPDDSDASVCPICGKVNCSGHDKGIPQPCDKAQALSLDTGFVSRIDGLYKKSYPFMAGDSEQGFIYTSKDKIIYPASSAMKQVKFTNDQVRGHEFEEWYHSHPTGAAIPSLADLKALATRYRQGHIKSVNFTYGVISEYGCLSIMISSFDNFTTFAKDIYESKFDDCWNSTININTEEKVPDFQVKVQRIISFFKANNAGLSVMFRPMQYEKDDENDNYNYKFKNWIPKDVDGNELIDKKCN